jgi:hypothetical protein
MGVLQPQQQQVVDRQPQQQQPIRIAARNDTKEPSKHFSFFLFRDYLLQLILKYEDNQVPASFYASIWGKKLQPHWKG